MAVGSVCSLLSVSSSLIQEGLRSKFVITSGKTPFQINSHSQVHCKQSLGGDHYSTPTGVKTETYLTREQTRGDMSKTWV